MTRVGITRQSLDSCSPNFIGGILPLNLAPNRPHVVLLCLVEVWSKLRPKELTVGELETRPHHVGTKSFAKDGTVMSIIDILPNATFRRLNIDHISPMAVDGAAQVPTRDPHFFTLLVVKPLRPRVADIEPNDEMVVRVITLIRGLQGSSLNVLSDIVEPSGVIRPRDGQVVMTTIRTVVFGSFIATPPEMRNVRGRESTHAFLKPLK